MTFVKFTLGDIRSAVKDKLDDQGFSDASIDRAANDFQFEIFNDNRIRFMEKNAVLSIGSGVTFKELPDDFMTLINLTILDNATTFRDITKDGYYTYDAFMNSFGNYTVAPASKIYTYTFYGEGLRFSAPTSGAYTANVDYLRSPALMVNASDECELPINARELMTLGTLERIMRINEDYNESDFEWNRLQSLRTAFIKNYARGGEKVGPQVIKGSRFRQRHYVQGEGM